MTDRPLPPALDDLAQQLRARVRHRARRPAPPSPDASDDPEAEAAARHDDATTARGVAILRLVAMGCRQSEIAARYGVTTRTIRNWIEEAQKRQLGAFRSTPPDALMAETDFLHTTLREELLRRMDAATVAGDTRLWIELVKQVRAVETDRYIVRERVGFFLNYAPPRYDDAGKRPVLGKIERHARAVEMTKRLVEIMAQSHEEADDDGARLS